jgi:hypothetical protein
MPLQNDGTSAGSWVALTVIGMLAEIPGVPPGLLILRMINRPKALSLTPIK